MVTRRQPWLQWLRALAGVISVAAASATATAQTVSGDAREIGLGSVDYAAEIFGDSAGAPSSMRFVLPFGLIQAASNWQKFKPSASAFDPSLALEYAAVPTHIVIGRNPSAPRSRFIADIRDANLNPDLNIYRGFQPAATLTGAGLIAPRFGRHFAIRPSSRFRQEIYAGAGPYLTVRSDLQFDQRLVSLLGASATTYVIGSALEIGNDSVGQIAAQFTGGYRAQLPLRASAGQLRLEANYNHLQGFRYEDVDLNLRLDTNAGGLVALDARRGAPLAIGRQSSSGGWGRSIDIGASAIFTRWRVSLRADGLANEITWRNVTRRAYEKSRLTGGISSFSRTLQESAPDIRYSLPHQYRVQSAYLAARWGVIGEIEHGLQRTVVSAGIERRYGALQVRGGGRHLDRVVLPSAGVSVRAGRAWLDVGAALTTANIERQRNVIIASSLRFEFPAPVIQ